MGISTALCSAIGYTAAANIAKESLRTGTPVKELVIQKGILSEREVEVLLEPFAMTGKPLGMIK